MTAANAPSAAALLQKLQQKKLLSNQFVNKNVSTAQRFSELLNEPLWTSITPVTRDVSGNVDLSGNLTGNVGPTGPTGPTGPAGPLDTHNVTFTGLFTVDDILAYTSLTVGKPQVGMNPYTLDVAGIVNANTMFYVDDLPLTTYFVSPTQLQTYVDGTVNTLYQDVLYSTRIALLTELQTGFFPVIDASINLLAQSQQIQDVSINLLDTQLQTFQSNTTLQLNTIVLPHLTQLDTSYTWLSGEYATTVADVASILANVPVYETRWLDTTAHLTQLDVSLNALRAADQVHETALVAFMLANTKQDISLNALIAQNVVYDNAFNTLYARDMIQDASLNAMATQRVASDASINTLTTLAASQTAATTALTTQTAALDSSLAALILYNVQVQDVSINALDARLTAQESQTGAQYAQLVAYNTIQDASATAQYGLYNAHLTQLDNSANALTTRIAGMGATTDASFAALATKTALYDTSFQWMTLTQQIQDVSINALFVRNQTVYDVSLTAIAAKNVQQDASFVYVQNKIAAYDAYNINNNYINQIQTTGLSTVASKTGYYDQKLPLIDSSINVLYNRMQAVDASVSWAQTQMTTQTANLTSMVNQVNGNVALLNTSLTDLSTYNTAVQDPSINYLMYMSTTVYDPVILSIHATNNRQDASWNWLYDYVNTQDAAQNASTATLSYVQSSVAGLTYDLSGVKFDNMLQDLSINTLRTAVTGAQAGIQSLYGNVSLLQNYVPGQYDASWTYLRTWIETVDGRTATKDAQQDASINGLRVSLQDLDDRMVTLSGQLDLTVADLRANVDALLQCRDTMSVEMSQTVNSVNLLQTSVDAWQTKSVQMDVSLGILHRDGYAVWPLSNYADLFFVTSGVLSLDLRELTDNVYHTTTFYLTQSPTRDGLNPSYRLTSGFQVDLVNFPTDRHWTTTRICLVYNSASPSTDRMDSPSLRFFVNGVQVTNVLSPPMAAGWFPTSTGVSSYWESWDIVTGATGSVVCIHVQRSLPVVS